MPPPAKGVRPQRTFLRSLRTALGTAAALGVAPYSMRGHRVVFSAWALPFHILCTFILPVFGTIAMISPNPIFKSSFFKFFLSIQIIPFYLSVIVILICNVVYRGDFGITALQLLRVERMFFILDVEPKIRNNILSDAILLLLVACFSVGHLILVKHHSLSALMIFVTFQYVNFYFLTKENLILFFVDSIQHYSDLLVSRATPREAVLVRLCTIHDRLADVTNRIQKIYGVPVLFMAVSSFFFINCNLFYAMKRSNKPVMVVALGWVVHSLAFIYRITKGCKRMKEKGEKFYSVLYMIMKKDKSRKLLDNSYLRAHLLKKRLFSFNLAGFSDVDLKLVAGMVSATATYTVILLQMGKNI